MKFVIETPLTSAVEGEEEGDEGEENSQVATVRDWPEAYGKVDRKVSHGHKTREEEGDRSSEDS